MTTTLGSSAIAIATAITTEALYRLAAWLSPAYPIGAFSYSHGVEYAVEAGLVTDRDTLIAWCAHLARHGAAWTDAVLIAHAHDAAARGDDAALDAIADLAVALRGTAETALETTQQGASFVATTRAAWADVALDRFAGRTVALPVAFAVAARGVDRRLAVAAYLQAVCANLVSAAVRLVPLGQTDGQRAVAALLPAVDDAAAAACATPLDDIGAAAPMVDWTSMQHETQYTRLFRS